MSVQLVCNGKWCVREYLCGIDAYGRPDVFHHPEELDRESIKDIRSRASRLGWTTEVTAPGDTLDYCPKCTAMRAMQNKTRGY